mmetsp:Transcript_417/g.919  ORF Transcript_417/g.919 Transcript_417/m.919 type:complete len:252 (-) Transcript_417:434-1189(-)
MLLGRGKTPQVPTLGWYASSSVVCEDGVHDPPMPEVVWPVEAVEDGTLDFDTSVPGGVFGTVAIVSSSGDNTSRRLAIDRNPPVFASALFTASTISPSSISPDSSSSSTFRRSMPIASDAASEVITVRSLRSSSVSTSNISSSPSSSSKSSISNAPNLGFLFSSSLAAVVCDDVTDTSMPNIRPTCRPLFPSNLEPNFSAYSSDTELDFGLIFPSCLSSEIFLRISFSLLPIRNSNRRCRGVVAMTDLSVR